MRASSTSPLRPTLERWLREAEAPGVAAARFDRRGLLDAAGAGLADVTAGRPAHAGSTWLWFSVTKVLTAELLLEAEGASKLALETPAAALLPAFRPRLLGGRRPDVSLSSLAAHTSGLPNPPPLRSLRAPADPPTAGATRIDRFMRWWPWLHAPPGARVAYSNLGFVVLGEAIAAAAGLPYRELARRRLEGLRADLEWTPDLDRDRAAGYLRRGRAFQGAMELLGAGRARGPASGPFRAYGPLVMDASAAGGLIADVEAVGTWLFGHLDPSAPPARARREVALQSGLGSGRGLAWRLGPGGTVEHQGSGLGFMAHVRLDPRRGLGACAVTNRSGDRGPDFAPIAALLDALLP